MLSAIALQRIGFGLVLIIVFSLGLASVLTAIGILWVKATEWFGQFSKGSRYAERIPGQKFLHALPALSALFIAMVGVGIIINALMQTGLLKI